MNFARGQESKLSDLTPLEELVVGVEAAGSPVFDVSCFGVDHPWLAPHLVASLVEADGPADADGDEGDVDLPVLRRVNGTVPGLEAFEPCQRGGLYRILHATRDRPSR
ncbi:MAG: hypothetical protein M3Q60_00135 [Actinomycetota bacterium]|nr:hypothetical protein [Actinomycetota bacterium]